jgi:non-specific serine/threonine protein kinase
MAGQTLSHYRLVKKLGEGGMGMVWQALDTKLDREIAIKILPDPFASDAERLSRFRREAKVIAALNHPNIVTIHSVEDTDGVHFITMELVRGKPLKALIPASGLPLASFLDIAVPLVAAIGAAHQKGITHRDLKPDNVMVGDDSSLRVLDFGLAQLRRDTSSTEAGSQTRTASLDGHVVGTVPYMSPEQLQGKSVDHRTDIFALGVIFYEMLGGQRPFQGATSVDLMSSILKDTPRSVTEIRRDLPGQAGRLVARCLEKEPIARFQSTLDLGNELEGLRRQSEKEPIPSIAVLPFADMSADKDQDYFCEGMAEEIINALTKLESLRVTSRTSAFGFKGASVDIGEIGRRLGVNHILEGSVRKAGDRLRITAQLINVADDFHLWSERYDREMKDVFAIQDEIARSVTEALKVTLSTKERSAIQRVPTRNVEAYDYFLRGRKYMYRWGVRNSELARRMFLRSVEIDPDFSLGYAGVADCCSLLYQLTHGDGERTSADRASKKAVELDPDSAEARVSRGFALSNLGRYEEAEREFETAIRLNPMLFEAYYLYGRACFAAGKLDKAARLLERACEVRPEDYLAVNLLPQLFTSLGREAEASAVSRRCLEVIERHVELNPDDARALCYGANAFIRLGERERGLDWARRALIVDPDGFEILYNIACVYSSAGEIEKAIDSLEKAVKAGYSHRAWIENDSDLDPLRDHPRFRAVVERLD